MIYHQGMRDEDETFADIVKQEFDEKWTPPASAPSPPVTHDPGPLPDFHLNLYDDDASYQDVPATVWRLSVPVRWGLGLIGAGLLIAIAKMTPLPLPGWIGWLAVACFVAGVIVTLWHVTHTQGPRDEEGTV